MAAIFDVFKKKVSEAKNKERIEKKPVVEKEEEKAPFIKDEKENKTKKIIKKKKVNIKKSELIAKTIRNPHITEKATLLSESAKYVFKVYNRANKIDVKRAVEALYGVNVLSVNILNTKSKKVRVGKIIGKKSGFKKAIVKIKKDQKIDITS
ncbi:MAG: 50S ribosomal protein L23 [Patescibacteria group bacterium]